MEKKIIVIGAGIAGLSAGCYVRLADGSEITGDYGMDNEFCLDEKTSCD